MFDYLVLLGFFLLLALVSKSYLTDPSFYRYGHFNADAVPELVAGIPLYKGTANRRTCHDEKQFDASTGAHIKVQCEVCHGTNRDHPDNDNMLIPADTIRLCSSCHEAMPSRPARQPQVVVAEHPSRDEVLTQCHTCHNPHSPADEGSAAEVPGRSIRLWS